MKLKKSHSPAPFDYDIMGALMFYRDAIHDSNLVVHFDCDRGKLTNPKPHSAEQVIGLLPGKEIKHEIYMRNTLYYSTDILAWWVKGGMRYLDVVKEKRKRYKLPSMVLKVQRGRMFIAAFEGTPSADTRLFTTPFRGIDVHGNAMGACRVNKPKQQRMQDRDEWENAFFKSKFNQAPKPNKKNLNMTIERFIFGY